MSIRELVAGALMQHLQQDRERNEELALCAIELEKAVVTLLAMGQDPVAAATAIVKQYAEGRGALSQDKLNELASHFGFVEGGGGVKALPNGTPASSGNGLVVVPGSYRDTRDAQFDLGRVRRA